MGSAGLHINTYDPNQLLQAVLEQNEMLKQMLTNQQTTEKPKAVPMKRLPLKAQLKQDFKTAFCKKWGIES